MSAQSGDRTFRVVAWPSEQRLVLYVPEIEAATTAPALPDAEAAARSLIAELTGIDAAVIHCDIRYAHARGRLNGLGAPWTDPFPGGRGGS